MRIENGAEDDGNWALVVAGMDDNAIRPMTTSMMFCHCSDDKHIFLGGWDWRGFVAERLSGPLSWTVDFFVVLV